MKKTYATVCQLSDSISCETLQDIGQFYYDTTDCGVSTEFLTKSGEAIHYNDKLSLLTRKLPNVLAANSIVGIKFSTIVEGSDAEFSADAIMFPCFESEINDALVYLEKLVTEFIKQ